MALRRRIKFQWRLFIPVYLLTIAIVGSVFYYHIYHEGELKTDLVHDQLNAVNGRIIEAYEKNIDLHQYMQFMERFYNNTMFDELRVSVYRSDGTPIYNLGDLIPLDISTHDYDSDDTRAGKTGRSKMSSNDKSQLFYLSEVQSNDGMITVLTAMPLTLSITDAISYNTDIWFLLIFLLIAATAVLYYSTRFLTRNIVLMRDFARRAAKQEVIDPNFNFPHDELGDISREIVALYSDKAKALARSEREHAIALNAVNEKARVKRELTNNINHELKTPIGVIRGYIDTILADPDMDPKLRQNFLERTRNNVERLCSLMDDVSTMTRLEDGSSTIPLSEVDFHDIIYNIDSDFEVTGMAPGMTFDYFIPVNCRVHANESLLQGMLLNLIRNAGLHSQGTEISLRVISESSKFYTFSFADNGRGVPEESIPHLFERFYRVDSGRSRKVGGTGLGLPIVKSTIVSMGGTISVHNRSTGGLEFVFTLAKWNPETNADKTAPAKKTETDK